MDTIRPESHLLRLVGKRQAESPVGVDHPFHQVFPMETRWEQTCRIHAKKSGSKCGSDWNRYLTRDFVIQVCKLVVVCATEKFPKKTFQKRSDDSTWAKCYAPHFLLCNMQQINMLTTFIYEINLLPTRLKPSDEYREMTSPISVAPLRGTAGFSAHSKVDVRATQT